MAESYLTEKIHDQVTWPSDWPVFDDGTGGLAFPEQNNSGCPIKSPIGIDIEPSVVYDGIGDNYSISCSPSYSMKIVPDRVYVRLSSFVYDGNRTFTTVDGYDKDFLNGKAAGIIPNTADPLSCTELVECQLTNIYPLVDDDLVWTYGYSMARPSDTFNNFNWTTNGDEYVTFDLEVDLNLGSDDAVYVNLQHQDDPSENGIYCYTAGVVRKVSSAYTPSVSHDDVIDDPTVNDNVPCCNHFRKTYSHKEVADYTTGLVGSVSSFGVKSMSVTDCDGGLIDWFTTNGEVNIGNGHEPLFVTGFGLGEFYRASGIGADVKEALPRDDYDENDNTRHPWLTWAYGTRSDSRTSTNLVALPRDWPFHPMDVSGKYDTINDTNNITLTKCCVTGSTTYGNLEYDRLDSKGNDEHVFINRHHVVVYPEFSTITTDAKKRVVVKPTFIHLPASMDTKDGETVELTVSIQNVDQTQFGDDSVETLSGYYAAMSQPRVYVMGGVQKFSNKRLPIDKESIVQHSEIVADEYESRLVFTDYIASTPVIAKSISGEPLEVGTQVRANIVVSQSNSTGKRRTFIATGTIVSIGGDGSSVACNGTMFQFDGKFPYDIGGRGWDNLVFTICGLAYLDENDNPSETKMGLAGRTEDVMRGDVGDGNVGDLNEFNKFFSISNKNEDTGRTELPHVDKRFLLATVYQTATSTFSWELVGRHRISKLARNWSDEHHRNRQYKSLVNLIYEENKTILDAFSGLPSLAIFAEDPKDYPVSYVYPNDSGWQWKTLGSVIQVKLPSLLGKAETEFYGNPVRQASRAMREFENDFNHMRLLSHGTKKARVKITGINIDRSTGQWPLAEERVVSDTIHPIIPSDTPSWASDVINSAWCANVRSLPNYVLNADSDGFPYSLFINGTNTIDTWTSYLNNVPYNTESDSEYEASACTDEEPNTVVGTPRNYTIYSCNSVCAKMVNRLQQSSKIENSGNWIKNIRRYAETVPAIKLSENLMKFPYSTDAILDWTVPFTRIMSLDGAPVPTITVATYSGLTTTAQQAFASFDAVQMYRYEYASEADHNGDDTIDEISTMMPTSTALANFIEKYVVVYGAEMYKHVYQGTRILLKNGKLPESNDQLYIRTIDRVRRRNADATAFVDRYIMDNFASIGGDTRDSNFDRVVINDAVSISMTEPPYYGTSGARYTNETYTRVFMQFTFSQKAGRWYTTDYRQYPTNYLSPLYGADAIDAGCYSVYNKNGSVFEPSDDTPVNIRPLWTNSACYGFNSYRSHIYTPYSIVPPMDFSLGCVPYMYGADPTSHAKPSDDPLFPYNEDGTLKPDWVFNGTIHSHAPVMKRLEDSYMPLEDGGIGLYPPANANGGFSEATVSGVHANFWSVRKFIRPAVSVLPGTDIPTYVSKDGDTDPESSHKWRNGGVISDPTLYDMFDFPVKGEHVYVMPNEIDPEDDMALQILLYHNPVEDEDGKMENRSNGKKHYMGYGLSAETQELNG